MSALYSPQLSVVRLRPCDPVPYDLLLLADETREAVDRYIHDCSVHVAHLQGQDGPVAVFAMKPDGDHAMELMNIAVDEVLRGLGIGTLLLEHVREVVKEEGRSVLRVGCADAGFGQYRFYVRNGFRVAGIRKDFYVKNYPMPIIENGIQLRDMLVLEMGVEQTRSCESTPTFGT